MSAIGINTKTVVRLLQMCQPQNLHAGSTMFEVGEEAQKKRFLDVLQEELNLPSQASILREAINRYPK